MLQGMFSKEGEDEMSCRSCAVSVQETAKETKKSKSSASKKVLVKTASKVEEAPVQTEAKDEKTAETKVEEAPEQLQAAANKEACENWMKECRTDFNVDACMSYKGFCLHSETADADTKGLLDGLAGPDPEAVADPTEELSEKATDVVKPAAESAEADPADGSEDRDVEEAEAATGEIRGEISAAGAGEAGVKEPKTLPEAPASSEESVEGEEATEEVPTEAEEAEKIAEKAEEAPAEAEAEETEESPNSSQFSIHYSERKGSQRSAALDLVHVRGNCLTVLLGIGWCFALGFCSSRVALLLLLLKPPRQYHAHYDRHHHASICATSITAPAPAPPPQVLQQMQIATTCHGRSSRSQSVFHVATLCCVELTVDQMA